jgi:uncharacterized protein YbjT (DUF2867 family)
MYAVTEITGRVGGGGGGTLLNAGLTVRAVVRNAAKGVAGKERGCEVALADMKGAPAPTAAFTGVNGAFVLIPSNFDRTPGLPEVRAVIHRADNGDRGRQATEGRLSLDHRRAGDAAEPAQPARYGGPLSDVHSTHSHSSFVNRGCRLNSS